MFDSVLSTPAMLAVFDDRAIVQAMLRFEAALADAEAAEGIIPQTAARAIDDACEAARFDIVAMIDAGRRAGSLAIPLVQELTRAVALRDAQAATHVHWGSTSQDVIDTAMVLVTRDALALIDGRLTALIQHLLSLAMQHLGTPVLARTLMQPAQVTSFGFKLVGWVAPLVRAHERLHGAAQTALQLQLGGAVGTLSVLGDQGTAVSVRMARSLGLRMADAAWHTQRDEWVRLGLELAVLVGSLGKIATDLCLMAQGEIAELAEPSSPGRGGSSAMPHKRNPVSAMIAIAAAQRTPHQAATLLACMGQQHERGLGNWQAELAVWPSLFLSADGALSALNDAMDGLVVDPSRMQRNIDALQGLVHAEAVSIDLAGVIGRPAAHALLQELSREAVAASRNLADVVAEAVAADPLLRSQIDPARLRALFDIHHAALPACTLAQRQLALLRARLTSKPGNLT